MDEVIAGANVCGYPLPTATALKQMQATAAMRPYKPSTLIDFEAGKPLELKAIWGEPLRRGTAAGAAMPELAALYAHLKELDATGRAAAAAVAHTPR